MAKTKQEKAEDQLIEKIYGQHCHGMQIDIMRIPKLFAMARGMLRESKDAATVGAAMVAFVKGE